MQQSLDGSPPNPYDDSLKVTCPLKPCLQGLKEQHKQIAKAHHERYTQVKQLAQAIESYSSHLEPSFTRVQLPPTADSATCPPTFDLSHAYFSKLDDEFTRVYQEYEKRVATVKALCAEIINLWAELGTPQAQTDSNIVALSQEAPEQLGLHQDDLKRLHQKRDKLVDEKKGREKRLKDLRAQIGGLWERLGIGEPEQKQFLAANRGCGMRTINEFEDELGRLNELKRQNLGLFVEEARIRLQELWDGLYFSEEEMLEFTPAFSGKSAFATASGEKSLTVNTDVYSDALLAAHEAEISRLEALKEQRAPVLEKIDKHRELIKEREDLAASSQDGSRLMAKKGERRDPTRLLREEKMRKRIAKDLPKLEAELRKVLAQWEDEYGRPFLIHGDRYLDELEKTSAKALPPRSKTPSIPANAPAHKKSASVSVSSKASTARGGPPPRSKTPSALGSATLPRNAAPPSVAHNTTTSKSPSRIPARAPLSNLQYGNNSPPKTGLTNGANTMRRMGPPARLPPPKMGDLFSKSTMAATPRPTSSHSAENVPSSGLVRHIVPEDIYDDRDDKTLTASSFQHRQTQAQFSKSAYYPHSTHQSMSSASSSTGYPSRPTSSNAFSASISTASSYTRPGNPTPYAMAPPAAPYTRPDSRAIENGTRQISNTSTASSAFSAAGGNQSGSENWETYSSASDADYDSRALSGATDDAAYYARLRAQASQGFLNGDGTQPQMKRSMPEGGWASPGGLKRARGLMAPVQKGVRPVYTGREESVIEGSEAGWTDDGDEVAF